MSGLKERLHGLPVWGCRDPADGRWHEDDTPREAATLIESQEAEIAALREALETIITEYESGSPASDLVGIAARAVEGKDG